MSPETILIVEDSATQAEALRYLLEECGYEVRVAVDGHEALAALHKAVPALVITDVVMPHMDGYELCERIKADEALRDVPVILLTSLADPQDIVRSLQSGADNFIRKPYDDTYLLLRVRNILTTRQLRDTGQLRVGVEVFLAGQRHFISAERQQILDFLLSTYEEVAQINGELAHKSERLWEANEELERRAAEVERTNLALEARQRDLEQALRDLDTERRRVQELADVNRAVLDASTDGITLVDMAGETVLTNAAFGHLTAVATTGEDAARPEPVDPVVAPAESSPEIRAVIESIISGSEPGTRDELQVPHAGRHLRVFTTPVADAAQRPIGRLVVLRDITAEHQAEQLKSDLIATISHELRTPLASVLGFAELLAARTLDDPTRMAYIDIIATEAGRLTDLLNDFLDLHSIEEGWFRLTGEPVDLVAVLRQQVATFAGQSPAHVLALHADDDPVRVVGEHKRLCQVVANLLSNAIKYSPEGGPIDVTGEDQGGVARVVVRDRGLGIPLAQQDKIFTKFFRVDSSDTREIGGTGLGLALCREIIEAHGGRIGFRSTEGAGTEFWFELPLLAGPGENESTPGPYADAGSVPAL